MADGKPDAVWYEEGYKRGDTAPARLGHVQETLGPILGGRVYSRQVGGGRWLATLSPQDTLLYPKLHARAGQERYRWEDQPDGTKHGFLEVESDDG